MARRIILLCVLFLFGCSTATQFRLPADSTLIIKNRKFVPQQDGYADVEVSPFFWTGVSYKLMKRNKVVQEGRLKSHFRPIAFFWPPAAILYWPKGFGADCYDLTGPATKAGPPECETVKHAIHTETEFESGQPWMRQ